MQQDKPRLIVFGATGNTGRHVIPYALPQGYKVRAFVRSPDKLRAMMNTDNQDLEIYQGDLQDKEQVLNACSDGAEHIIFVAGLPNFKWHKQTRGAMLQAVKNVHAGMVKHQVKKILYLAGTPNPAPQQKLSIGIKMLKLFLIVCLGDQWNIRDNDDVIEFFTSQNKVNYVVIRPLFLFGQTQRHQLRASNTVGPMVSFTDLGQFAVRAVGDESLVNKFTYVSKYTDYSR
ncbi:MAG TPA: NAD(P)-dependent oxidoreductase [Oceanospirillaceae bacterium]|nr:NAD(P)-dependent oxidoreductase [Oceanospirillaceae bacterium]